MSYIGATGLNEIDDLIEDATNTLINRIIIEDIYGSNYTDRVSIFSSNYTDKVGIYGSNYTDRQIKDTSNYADRLDLRIKALEGTEGSPGDISLGVPAIPSTGLIALAGSIALATGACIMVNGTTTLVYIDSVNTKVDSNKTEVDKIGGWSSNYSDKVVSASYNDRSRFWK